jgi:hypothetical protein
MSPQDIAFRAELSGAYSDKFGLDRPAPGDWQAPKNIALRTYAGTKAITFSWRDGATVHTPRVRMLEDFLSLAEEPDDAILSYARRWGVLELCRHGLPASHNKFFISQPPDCLACESLRIEALDEWRRLSRAMGAALIIDAALEQRTTPDSAVWQLMPAPYDSCFWRRGSKRDQVRIEKMYLADVLRDWMHFGDVRISPSWRSNSTEVCLSLDIEYGGLFGALTMQLALALTKSDGYAICDGCQHPYFPKRRPRPDRQNFCPKCQAKGIAHRFAANRWRRKKTIED